MRTSHATFDVEPRGVAWRERCLDEHADEEHLVLVSVEGSTLIGYASSSPYRPRPAYDTTVETSVYVHPGHLGRGVGSALYARLLEALDRTNLHRAVASISLPNPSSVALHERFGFTRVGLFTEQGRKFGRYRDVAWYERPIGGIAVALRIGGAAR